MTVTLLAFWISLLLLLYGYAGFPLLVAAVGRLRDRRVRREPHVPTVSLVIAAYNEEEEIERRIENALHSDYPAGALEIIVASDGSSDGTERIVSRMDPERVCLLALPRRGKAHALNEAVRHSRGEILVFSDANTRFEPDALRMLVRNFADPEVGGVAGHTGYVTDEASESAGRGEDLYWRYDTWLKRLETLTGSVVSAHGGMYAIRRALFRPLTDAAVTDDFAISTAVVEQGARLVFEPEARGYETTVKESHREFQRRVRLMTRGLRGVLLRRALLNPWRYGFYSVSFFSRKVLRRLLALLLPVLFLSSVVLVPRGSFYLAAAAAQGVFYSLALGGWVLRGRAAGKWKLFYVPFFYSMANLASVAALWNVARGRRIVRWDPQRHGAGDDAVPESPSPGQEIAAGSEVRLPAGVAEALGRKGIRYCLLRRPRPPSTCTSRLDVADLLVEEEDAAALEGVFLDRGFLRAPPSGAAFRSHLLGPSPAEAEWLRIDVRTEIRYGRGRSRFRSGEGSDRILRRRRWEAGLPVPSPDDELLDLLLHAVLDHEELHAAARHRLRELVRLLRRCPPLAGRAAERVQRELAPAVTWDRLLECVLEERWRRLERCRGALRRRLARSDRHVRLAPRAPVDTHPSFSRRPRLAPAGSGRIVAALGPGGGRGPMLLARVLPLPSRAAGPRRSELSGTLGPSLHRASGFLSRALLVQWLRALGHLVVVVDPSRPEEALRGEAASRLWTEGRS